MSTSLGSREVIDNAGGCSFFRVKGVAIGYNGEDSGDEEDEDQHRLLI